MDERSLSPKQNHVTHTKSLEGRGHGCWRRDQTGPREDGRSGVMGRAEARLAEFAREGEVTWAELFLKNHDCRYKEGRVDCLPRGDTFRVEFYLGGGFSTFLFASCLFVTESCFPGGIEKS